MSLNVFISYSTFDIQNAKILAGSVLQAGAQPFIAQYSLPPGAPLDSAIINEIKKCDIFLLLWSENAKNSEWVSQEIGIAVSNGKYIIPLILHKDIELPGFIKNLKYIDASNDPIAAINEVNSFINKIVVNQREQAQQVQLQQQQNALIFLGVAAAIALLIVSAGNK